MGSNIPTAWLSSTYDSIPSISVPALMESCAVSLNQSAGGKSPCDASCVAAANAFFSGLASLGCGAAARACWAKKNFKLAIAFGFLSATSLCYGVTTTALFVMDKMNATQRNNSDSLSLTQYDHFNSEWSLGQPPVRQPSGCPVTFESKNQSVGLFG